MAEPNLEKEWDWAKVKELRLLKDMLRRLINKEILKPPQNRGDPDCDPFVIPGLRRAIEVIDKRIARIEAT